MPPSSARRRCRSISGGSCKEMMAAVLPGSEDTRRTSASMMTTTNTTTTTANNPSAEQQTFTTKAAAAAELSSATKDAHNLIRTIAKVRTNSASGKAFLHCSDENLALAVALIHRAQQLDQFMENSAAAVQNSSFRSNNKSNNRRESETIPNRQALRDLLLASDDESGYTPLHWAVYRGDLASLLLFLRHAYSYETSRFAQRPMTLLQGNAFGSVSAATGADAGAGAGNIGSTSNPELLQQVVSAVDNEKYTAADLLAALQRPELLACRLSLPRTRIRVPLSPLDAGIGATTTSSRHRRVSFDDNDNLDGEDDDQNEFDVLSRNMDLLSMRQQATADSSSSEEGEQEDQRSNDNFQIMEKTVSYGCEVFTFGRAHHCALGVVSHCGSESSAPTKVRPQRVQAFAQGQVGREGGAVAVAGATHHTLVATAAGHLYAFGLGKSGRLGTGNEANCASPTRVLGALKSQRVISVTAAENHSLCVTQSGCVFSWGSNRFGQLGISSHDQNKDNGNRCLPRRIDDLKHVFCVSVAAGLRHSVAISKYGEVYAWGDNTSGQLGTSRTGAMQKVQRVEPLWNCNPPKAAVAISASEQSTLALTVPSGTGLPINTIYSWGYGNHVPSRVHFEVSGENSSRPVNPIAIDCAKHHNVAITSDGMVYSWGLHGFCNNKSRNTPSQSTAITSPQLVTGMLPENGGGIAVAVSGSENHTAVVTDDGRLFTWGDNTSGQLGASRGVRWQPDPKQVIGVHRAVGVSAAKEHTILLIGTSFPSIPPLVNGSSLEAMAARKIAEHVDLFNILPVLIMAHRTDCSFLLEYCNDFVRRNLDGVLNVSQKSVVDCYMKEQLRCSVIQRNLDNDGLDLVFDAVTAGNEGLASFSRGALCDIADWLEACASLSKTPLVARMIRKYSLSLPSSVRGNSVRKSQRSLSFSESVSDVLPSSKRDQNSSQRRPLLASKNDLSSRQSMEASHACLLKEVRGLRKRLSQIDRLKSPNHGSVKLSREETDKIARRPQIEADLVAVETALKTVEGQLRDFTNNDLNGGTTSEDMTKGTPNTDSAKKKLVAVEPSTFRCEVCKIMCPDRRSYELHINGRKHRNRVAMVAEEEKQIAAASMMGHHQRQQLSSPSAAFHRKSEKTSPWKGNAIQPAYKLPPPPHPIADTLVSPPSAKLTGTKKSFRRIMEEESEKSQTTRGEVLNGSAKPPPGSSPLPVSQCWASPAVARISVPSKPISGALSLSDFIKPNVSKETQANPPSHWASPSNTTKRGPTRAAISFLDIQQKEEDFKAKQDQACDISGRWFIQQRPRAGSFMEIQKNDAIERDERLFVEEQIRIEKEILEEQAAKKAAKIKVQKRQDGKTARAKPKNNNNRGKGRKKKAPAAAACRNRDLK